jgi:hypothetical protein
MTVPLGPSGQPDYGQAHLGTGDLDVAMTTLDLLAEEQSLSRVDLIKVDAEGAEALILEGAVRVLERDRPALICEMQDIWSARYGRDAQSTFSLLSALGYSAVAFVDGRLRPVHEATSSIVNYLFLPN